MIIKKHIIALFFLVLSAAFLSCTEKKHQEASVSFTKTDSLTETYLNLQDTMLHAWNMMINDDNHKLKAMGSLLHELKVCGQFSPEQISALEQRLDQLKRIRYTHKTMSNIDVVEEYDFASNSIINELISLAESHTAFSYNVVLQGMVEDIRAADQRVALYRAEYDTAARAYNKFLDKNEEYLSEMADNGTLEKKPLFHMASE